MYPAPPNEIPTANYSSPVHCDIIGDQLYIHDYVCEAPCQMDPSKTVEVECNCFFEFGPISYVVPCEWKFRDSGSCPEVPEDQQFDWECDPRIDECPQDQYPDFASTNETTEENNTTTTEIGNNSDELTTTAPLITTEQKQNQTDIGSLSGNLPYYQFPMQSVPGQAAGPVIFSPVISPVISPIITVANISSNIENAPQKDSLAAAQSAQSAPETSLNDTNDVNLQPTVSSNLNSFVQTSDVEQAVILAETQGKLRNIKSLYNALKKNMEREREEYEERIKDSKLLYEKAVEKADELQKVFLDKLVNMNNSDADAASNSTGPSKPNARGSRMK